MGVSVQMPQGRESLWPFMLKDRELCRPALNMIVHWCAHNATLSRQILEILLKALIAEVRAYPLLGVVPLRAPH